MSKQPSYQVLARKYRPETFADLVGQDAMVRTLKNAFEADRIAQAFMMTGIRGTGKTTTARIIAKGMNCIGLDGLGGATTEPCGECEHCRAIMEGRHVDVIEMDAASRTGVGDIREIIDTVHYRAASARYKIYIIDEVHMLSKNAFNALLKTLEEPPEHVKFIFATTEIRQVPVTVLSRCQRFDLRRIEPDVMIALLQKIAKLEEAAIAEDALALIARAAEGSARDATSLLDQAISHGAGETTVEQVRAMLGLADRGRVLDLFDLIVKGDAAGALNEVSAQYADGADPLAILRDLAEVCHWVSVCKVTPEAGEDPTIGPDERERSLEMAKALPMRVLTRLWQMLLLALEEASRAPNAMMATQMAIIRLTHVSDLPAPEELVRKLQNSPPPTGMPAPSAPRVQTAGPTQEAVSLAPSYTTPTTPVQSGSTQAVLAHQVEDELSYYVSFEHVLELIRRQRDVQLLVEVEGGVHLVRYQPGRIELNLSERASPHLVGKLGAALQRWTGQRWAIIVVNEDGAPTISQQRDAEDIAMRETIMSHESVAQIFQIFPKAKISRIQTLQELNHTALLEALPEVQDEWDPFEDD